MLEISIRFVTFYIVTLFYCILIFNDFIFIHRVCKTCAIVTCFYYLTWLRNCLLTHSHSLRFSATFYGMCLQEHFLLRLPSFHVWRG